MAKGWRLYGYDRRRFGGRVRACRQLLGWSGRCLARAAGLNSGSLARAERGEASLPPDRRRAVVVALADALASKAGPVSPLIRAELWESANLPIEGVADGTAAGPPFLALHAGGGSPRRGNPKAAGGEAGWGDPFAEGCRLVAANAWEGALPHLRAARAAAADAEARAQVLATEAEARWHLGAYAAALRAGRAALAELGLDEAPPEAGRLPPGLARAGERALGAYGWVALRLGMSHYRLGRFGDAGRYLDTAREAGRVLGDGALQFEALHMTMRVRFDQGTVAAADGGWREPRDWAALESALGCLTEIERRGLCPTDDVSWAHHFRWTDRVLRLLGGNPDQAARARRRAAALFGAHPGIGHVWLDQGRLALDDDDPGLARRCLEAALEIAADTRYAETVFDALSGLGYLASQSPTDYEAALDLCICALLAYPPVSLDVDGRRTLALCDDLVGALAGERATTPERFWSRYQHGLEEAVAAGDRPPFAYLGGLHTARPGNVDRMLAFLGKRFVPPGPR